MWCEWYQTSFTHSSIYLIYELFVSYRRDVSDKLESMVYFQKNSFFIMTPLIGDVYERNTLPLNTLETSLESLKFYEKLVTYKPAVKQTFNSNFYFKYLHFLINVCFFFSNISCLKQILVSLLRQLYGGKFPYVFPD